MRKTARKQGEKVQYICNALNVYKNNTKEKKTKILYLNSFIPVFLMQNKFIQFRLQQQQGLTAENALCKLFFVLLQF